eukprot:1758042-Lingulodinium_polyedra.AAC.1
MAPELFQAHAPPPRPSADVLSLGMLLCVAATRRHPRAGMSHQQLRRALRRSQPIKPEWPEGSVSSRTAGRSWRSACRWTSEECASGWPTAW